MTALVDPLDADRQVSLEKMRASGLDVGFFVVSGGQPAEGRNGGDVPRTEVSVELGHEDFDRRFSPANRSDFVDHMDYIVGLIGIDHVGFSSDFGGGGGVDGLEDASETFDVTLELTCPGVLGRWEPSPRVARSRTGCAAELGG